MKKIFSFSNVKVLLILIILLFIYTTICAFSYVNAVSSNIQETVFRLHVIANSDSQEDQNLKYLVRDSILDYINSISNNKNLSKEDIILLVKTNINKIKTIAEDTIKKNGYNYTVNLKVGSFPFPTKNYGDISFPSGYYDALKVEIGEAKGQNWWCVMFPPLCFVDVTNGVVPNDSKEIMKDNLSEEEYALLSENRNDINFKFKIVELFQNLSIKIAQR